MNYNVPGQPSPAEDRAKSAAILLAQLAGWQFETKSLMLPIKAKGFILAPAIDLLIVPVVGPIRAQRAKVAHIARQTCCDILMVGVSETRPAHLYCSVGLWSAAGMVWYAGMFWMSKFAEPWIIPDPKDFDPGDRHFPLVPGRLRAAADPDPEALANPDGGFHRADHVVAVAGVE